VDEASHVGINGCDGGVAEGMRFARGHGSIYA
jgi:hypothetical protein